MIIRRCHAGRAHGAPEPLASVMDYLAKDLDGRKFVSTAELVGALDVEPIVFGRQMGEHGCKSTRERITTNEGIRQVRGYLVANVRAAASTYRKASDDGH